MDDHLRVEAREAVRRRIHEALLEEIRGGADCDLGPVEAAVCEALDDPRIAWALAYHAGAQMAPAKLRRPRRGQEASDPADAGYVSPAPTGGEA